MAKHFLILTLLAAAAALQTHAQSDDFGIWTEADVEKKISKKLTLDGSFELRTRDDGFGELDRWSVGVGATYKLTDWLKASVGYVFLNDNNHKVNDSGKKYADYWGQRHRFNVSLTPRRTLATSPSRCVSAGSTPIVLRRPCSAIPMLTTTIGTMARQET